MPTLAASPVAIEPVGVICALTTAVLWALSPMFMASIGRRIGSYHTNLLRILIAFSALLFLILPVHLLFRANINFPTWPQIAWLSLSGIAGMVIGDAFFYEALVRIGPRRAIKLNTLAPVVALVIAYFFLQEIPSRLALVGVAIVIAAVMYATFAKSPSIKISANEPIEIQPTERTTSEIQPVANTPEPGIMTPFGLFIGIASACCIALGSVLTRKAYDVTPENNLDPIVATVFRVGAGTLSLWVWPLISGKSPRVLAHLKNPTIRIRMFIGASLGPFAGMLFYVTALKYSPAGLVSTLVATSPLIVIPVVAFRYRTKIHIGIVIAALCAIAGVALISIR